jgi:hypothetical protein
MVRTRAVAGTVSNGYDRRRGYRESVILVTALEERSAALRRDRAILLVTAPSNFPVRPTRCHDLLGFALGLGLPWLTVVATFRMGRWWSNAVAIAAVLPLVLYSFVFILGTAIAGFDRFAETRWKGSDVRFYRTDGGAITDVGVVIRQERTLLPGVLLVRRVDDFYPCYSLDATSTDSGITITDERSDCRAFPEQRCEYRLKPFVYFYSNLLFLKFVDVY